MEIKPSSSSTSFLPPINITQNTMISNSDLSADNIITTTKPNNSRSEALANHRANMSATQDGQDKETIEYPLSQQNTSSLQEEQGNIKVLTSVEM